jgi:hypothetical protein
MPLCSAASAVRRKREKSVLSDLLQDSANRDGRRKITLVSDMVDYHQKRLIGKEAPDREAVQQALVNSGLHPDYPITDESGKHPTGVETHLFRNGGVTIIALLTNPQLRVDELGPPEFKSNDRFAKPRTVQLAFQREMYVYDVRAAKTLGRQKQITITLDPYDPAIFAASPVAIAELEISAPVRIQRGESAQIGLGFAHASPAATHVFHLDVIDPAGKTVDYYSGNIIASHGRAAKWLPLAFNDAQTTRKLHPLTRQALDGLRNYIEARRERDDLAGGRHLFGRRRFLSEQSGKVVPQLDLGALSLHDDALLDDRQ